jgi:hypothetical protein
MRRIAIAGLLVALVEFAAGAVAEEPVEPKLAPIGVQYVWQGPMGSLSIANAEGLPFFAWAIDGAPVAQGVVQGPFMSLMVPNHGQMPNGTVLLVRVHDKTFVMDDDDWHWE